MVVVGQTTAVVATTAYVPPYKYVTSYAPAVSVTGTITKPISNNPTVAPDTSDSDYAWAYLQSHMMSWPSYRYIYLLWIILALLGGIYVLSHHLRLGSSRPAMAISRWSIRRRPIGKKKGSSGAQSRALPSNGTILCIALFSLIVLLVSLVGADYVSPLSSTLNFASSFRKRASTSSSVSASATADSGLDTVLGKRQLLMPGQIAFNSPGYTISKSAWTLGSRFGDVAFALFPLVVLLAMKSAPFAILSWKSLAHLYADKLATLHKAAAWLVWLATTAHVVLWTIQLFVDSRNGKATWFAMWTNYRFISGVAAYTCMTALMVASMRFVRKKRYEFFYLAHVILVFLTLALSALHHPVLWFWIAGALGLWIAERLWRVGRVWRINGFSSPRKPSSFSLPRGGSKTEARYADLPQHEDADAYAMSDIKAGGPMAYSDKMLPPPPGMGGGRGDWTPDSSPGSLTSDLPADRDRDRGYVHVRRPSAVPFAASGSNPAGPSPGGESAKGYFDEAFQPLGERRYSELSQSQDQSGRYGGGGGGQNTYTDPYAAQGNHRGTVHSTSGTLAGLDYNEKRSGDHKGNTLQLGAPINLTTSAAAERGLAIPPGYAMAQLLPSRTVRLTIRIPRPAALRWSAGQSVLLYLPDLSRIQSHPFTIVNAPPPANTPSSEITLLVKARKGLTRTLFEHVRSKSMNSMNTDTLVSSATRPSFGGGGRASKELPAVQDAKDGFTPIFVRAKVDGPFGSAARVRWRDYSSVMIVCGGSGVSFGIAILEHVVDLIGSGKGKLRRVRLCWVAREYAEIAWVAFTLRRLTSMLPVNALEIDIYITNAQPRGSPITPKRPLTFASVLSGPGMRGSEAYDDPEGLAPPRAAFAGGGKSSRRASSDSLSSSFSVSSDLSVDAGSEAEGETDAEREMDMEGGGASYADVLDFTNYEDEEDIVDPAEEELSSRLKGEGKVRRAKSRRAAKRGEKGGAPGGRKGKGSEARLSSSLAPGAREQYHQQQQQQQVDLDATPRGKARSRSMLGDQQGAQEGRRTVSLVNPNPHGGHLPTSMSMPYGQQMSKYGRGGEGSLMMPKPRTASSSGLLEARPQQHRQSGDLPRSSTTPSPGPRADSAAGSSSESSGGLDDPLRPSSTSSNTLAPPSAPFRQSQSMGSFGSGGNSNASSNANLNVGGTNTGLSPDWGAAADKRASYRSNLSGMSGAPSYASGINMHYDSPPIPGFRSDSPSSQIGYGGGGSGAGGGSGQGYPYGYGGYGYGDGDAGSIADSSRGFAQGGESPGMRSVQLPSRYSRVGSMVFVDDPAAGPATGIGAQGRSSKGNATTGAAGRGGMMTLAPNVPGLWVDLADYESMAHMAEYARTGKPALGKLLDEEMQLAEGQMIVATCGPVTLNTVVRNMVSKRVVPANSKGRDKRGHVALYSEDYD